MVVGDQRWSLRRDALAPTQPRGFSSSRGVVWCSRVIRRVPVCGPRVFPPGERVDGLRRFYSTKIHKNLKKRFGSLKYPLCARPTQRAHTNTTAVSRVHTTSSLHGYNTGSRLQYTGTRVRCGAHYTVLLLYPYTALYGSGTG